MTAQRRLRLARTGLISLLLLAALSVLVLELVSPSAEPTVLDLSMIDPSEGAVIPVENDSPIPATEELTPMPHAPRPKRAAPWTYTIRVEAGLDTDGEFASLVRRVLHDPRGWSQRRHFLEAKQGETPNFWIVLASPSNVDRLCAPLRTEGTYSCGLTGIAVINAKRWRDGAVPPARESWLGESLDSYRVMVLNHEIGHVLGLGHKGCHAPGQPASIMAQQTINLKGCLPNPWPTEEDLNALK